MKKRAGRHWANAGYLAGCALGGSIFLYPELAPGKGPVLIALAGLGVLWVSLPRHMAGVSLFLLTAWGIPAWAGILPGWPDVMSLAVALSVMGAMARQTRLRRREKNRFYLLEQKVGSLEETKESLSSESPGLHDTAHEALDPAFAPVSLDAFTSLENHLNGLLRLIQGAMGARSAVFFGWDPAGEKLFVRAHYSESDSFDDQCVLAAEQFPIGWVATKKTPYFYPKERHMLDTGYYSRHEAVHSFVAVPALKNDRLEGVLAVDHPEVGAFIAHDIERLKIWAGMLAQTLKLWRAVVQFDETNRDLHALYDGVRNMGGHIAVNDILSTFHRAAYGMVPFDFAAVCFFTPRRKTYRVYELASEEKALEIWDEKKTSDSWARRIFEKFDDPVCLSRESDLVSMPLYSEKHPQRGTRSIAGFPLLTASRKKVGVLLMGSRQSEAFRSRAIQLMKILVSHMGLLLETARMYEQLEDQASTDGLTGLNNRRAFQERLAEEVLRAERNQTPLSLIFLDIDHFKRLNDTFGHAAGDAVLRQLSALLQKQCRDLDFPSRYGGEEFTIILSGADAAQAMKTAERIRSQVEKTTFTFENHELPVTASFGVSGFPGQACTLDALLSAADAALYVSKENGRNRVTHASELK